jgi:hypothetical protein
MGRLPSRRSAFCVVPHVDDSAVLRDVPRHQAIGRALGPGARVDVHALTVEAPAVERADDVVALDTPAVPQVGTLMGTSSVEDADVTESAAIGDQLPSEQPQWHGLTTRQVHGTTYREPSRPMSGIDQILIFNYPTSGVSEVALLAIIVGAIAGVLVGMVGAVYGHLLSRISAESFDVVTSINAVALTVLGGIGLLAGPILGAFYIIGLPRFLPLDNAGLAASALGWLLLILYFPGGIAQVVAMPRRRIIHYLARRRGIDIEAVEAGEEGDDTAGIDAQGTPRRSSTLTSTSFLSAWPTSPSARGADMESRVWHHGNVVKGGRGNSIGSNLDP